MDKRSYRERAAYITAAVSKRRRKLKEMIVAYKGGCCEMCGYKRCVWAMDFHHRDPRTKKFAISGMGITRAWETVKKEADKCILVCANCHREIESGKVKVTRSLEKFLPG